jgi:competence protein ComGC
MDNTSGKNYGGKSMKKGKILSVLLATTITVSCATALTAQALNNAGTEKARGNGFMAYEKKGENVKVGSSHAPKLDSLVTDGTITQDQKNAIVRALESAGMSAIKVDSSEPRGGIKNILGSLVTAGTITSDQSESILKSISDTMKAQKEEGSLSSVLESLISAGTITAEQATAIKSAAESAKRVA